MWRELEGNWDFLLLCDKSAKKSWKHKLCELALPLLIEKGSQDHMSFFSSFKPLLWRSHIAAVLPFKGLQLRISLELGNNFSYISVKNSHLTHRFLYRSLIILLKRATLSHCSFTLSWLSHILSFITWLCFAAISWSKISFFYIL